MVLASQERGHLARNQRRGRGRPGEATSSAAAATAQPVPGGGTTLMAAGSGQKSSPEGPAQRELQTPPHHCLRRKIPWGSFISDPTGTRSSQACVPVPRPALPAMPIFLIPPSPPPRLLAPSPKLHLFGDRHILSPPALLFTEYFSLK